MRPNYHSTGANAYLRRAAATRPQCSPLPHEDMNISQPEHGRNGESLAVVN
jgi:hypothetical protein